MSFFTHRDGELHAEDVAVARIADEVGRYWEFVYRKQRGTADPTTRALMERQQHYGGWLGRPSQRLRVQLRERLGDPIFVDDDVVVWRLRGDDGVDS